MNAVLIMLMALIAGCSTVSSRPDFPSLPPSLETSCPPELSLIPLGTDRPSEVLTIVKNNYGQYHECKAKVDAWQSWYSKQKKIYDSK